MMKGLGHTVYLYAGTENEAAVDELIPCITETQRRLAVGNKPYVEAGLARRRKSEGEAWKKG